MSPRIGKTAYFLLSLTWGLPLTLAGAVAAAVLRLTGHRPARWGYGWCFEAGKDWGGVSLGPVSITDRTSGEAMKAHEFGHSIQNCYFGLLQPLLVSLPSAVRYRRRRYLQRRGSASLPPYDSVWFEGQATRLGTEFARWKAGAQDAKEK